MPIRLTSGQESGCNALRTQWAIVLFIYLFLGLCCCIRVFSSCRNEGQFPSCCAWASHCGGFSCCRAQALSTLVQQLPLTGSTVGTQQLWHMDLVAPRYVESFQTRDLTHVPCIGRWILIHYTTREILQFYNQRKSGEGEKTNFLLIFEQTSCFHHQLLQVEQFSCPYMVKPELS